MALQYLTYAAEMLRAMPPWLTRTVGGAVSSAIGEQLDSIADRTARGVKARFPGYMTTDAVDALPYIGNDRRIARGPNETAAAYSSRLTRWFDDHKTRGGPYALLNQLGGFWSADPRVIDVVYPSGVMFTRALDGTITRTTHSTNADLTRWARATVVYHLAANPTPIAYGDYLALMSVPLDWNSAHTLPLQVVAVWGNAELWGDQGLWGQPSTALWGGGIVVSDLYPNGAPASFGVTVGGLPLTVGGQTVTVSP